MKVDMPSASIALATSPTDRLQMGQVDAINTASTPCSFSLRAASGDVFPPFEERHQRVPIARILALESGQKAARKRPFRNSLCCSLSLEILDPGEGCGTRIFQQLVIDRKRCTSLLWGVRLEDDGPYCTERCAE